MSSRSDVTPPNRKKKPAGVKRAQGAGKGAGFIECLARVVQTLIARAETSVMYGLTDEVLVAVGPSVSTRKKQLENRLGRGFAVVDVLGPQRPAAGDIWVAVVGSSQLPSGEILTKRKSRRGSLVLVGTGARPDGEHDDTVGADQLADAVRHLSGRSRNPRIPGPEGEAA